jgi:hypothetical protein
MEKLNTSNRVNNSLFKFLVLNLLSLFRFLLVKIVSTTEIALEVFSFRLSASQPDKKLRLGNHVKILVVDPTKSNLYFLTANEL